MIRFASYNIRKAIGTDRRRSPERILQVLAEIDADVIALQEADRRFGKRQRALPAHLIEDHGQWRDLPLGMRPASMGWHGNALLVRDGTIAHAVTTIALPSLEPRGAVIADLERDGFVFRVVGMHLDLSGLWRRRQAHHLLERLRTMQPALPCIAMGDLNEWSSYAGCLRDFARQFSFAETGPSFHARRPIARLDRIMLSRDLRVRACGVHASLAARTGSDHLPIWAEIDRR